MEVMGENKVLKKQDDNKTTPDATLSQDARFPIHS